MPGLLLHRIIALCIGAASVVGCGGSDEMRIVSRLDSPIRLDILAPRTDLRGGCDVEFARRYCEEEYENIGVVDIAAGEERFLTISDPVTNEQCTNILWLRIPFLGDVGPIEDPGTTLHLPAVAEIEAGAGRYHSVAFPQATIRIDDVSEGDPNQGLPPPTCAELGRAAR